MLAVDTLSIVKLVYLVAAVLFILGLKNMTHPRTAVRGNLLGGCGMLLAMVVALVTVAAGPRPNYVYMVLGIVIGSAHWWRAGIPHSDDRHASAGCLV